MDVTQNTLKEDVAGWLGVGEDEELRTSARRRSYLQKVGRLLTTARPDLTIDRAIPTAAVSQGRENPLIRIGGREFEQPDTGLPRQIYDLTMQEALLMHELGHILYTDHDDFKTRIGDADLEYKSLFREIWNVLEDGAIEQALRHDLDVSDELAIANRNLRGEDRVGIEWEESRRYGFVGAVRCGLMDMAVWDSGEFEKILDPACENVTLASSDDREQLLSFVPVMQQVVSEVLTEPEGAERNRIIEDFFEALTNELPDVDVEGDLSDDRGDDDNLSDLFGDDENDGSAGDKAEGKPDDAESETGEPIEDADQLADESNVEQVCEIVEGFDPDADPVGDPEAGDDRDAEGDGGDDADGQDDSRDDAGDDGGAGEDDAGDAVDEGADDESGGAGDDDGDEGEDGAEEGGGAGDSGDEPRGEGGENDNADVGGGDDGETDGEKGESGGGGGDEGSDVSESASSSAGGGSGAGGGSHNDGDGDDGSVGSGEDAANDSETGEDSSDSPVNQGGSDESADDGGDDGSGAGDGSAESHSPDQDGDDAATDDGDGEGGGSSGEDGDEDGDSALESRDGIDEDGVEADMESELRSEAEELDGGRAMIDAAMDYRDMMDEIDAGSNTSGDEDLRADRIIIPDETPDRWDSEGYEAARRVKQRIVTPLRNNLQMAEKDRVLRERRRGSFDPKRMMSASRGSTRVFEQVEEGENKDYECIVLLDRSGSMSGNDVQAAERAGTAFALALEEVGVDVEMMDLVDNVTNLVKPFEVDVRRRKEHLCHNGTSGTTPISQCLQLARTRLRGAENPFVVVVTDGKPDNSAAYTTELDRFTFPVLGLYIGTENDEGKHSDRFHAQSYVETGETDAGEIGDALYDLAADVMF